MGSRVISIDGLKVRLHSKYIIGMSAIEWGSPGVIVIDRKYLLREGSAHEGVAGFCPLAGVEPITFEQALFYVHCLSYETDLPIAFERTDRWSPTRAQPAFRRRRPRQGTDSFDPVKEALLYLTDERLGDLGAIEFPRPPGDERFDLPFSSMYGPVDEMVRMYSTALRQLDPMSEYLHYYRVIERADGKNGVGWLKTHLGNLRAFNFGRLWASAEDLPGARGHETRRNLFAIHKRRAITRLTSLQRRLATGTPPTTVEHYLYNVQRCGIAHGKTGIKTYDFRYELSEAAKDVYLVKMLARMAIEDRVPASARPRR